MKWYFWVLLVLGVATVTAVIVQTEWYKNWMSKMSGGSTSTTTPVEPPANYQRL